MTDLKNGWGRGLDPKRCLNVLIGPPQQTYVHERSRGKPAHDKKFLKILGQAIPGITGGSKLNISVKISIKTEF
jgi:hypothetical protein